MVCLTKKSNPLYDSKGELKNAHPEFDKDVVDDDSDSSSNSSSDDELDVDAPELTRSASKN